MPRRHSGGCLCCMLEVVGVEGEDCMLVALTEVLAAS